LTTASLNETERNNLVRDFLEDILPLMGVSAEVDVVGEGDSINANISGKDLNVLIGGHGKTLNALQCLANVAVNRNSDAWTRVIVDAEGYRERRRESLEKIASSTADQAVAEGAEILLEPMNAFERRIVHCALAERTDIFTDSRGEEPYRCVVIAPAKSAE
jgi:spoIIIJ-associated protein